MPHSWQPWQDPDRPVEQRVADLLSRMTLEEKVAQLYSVWPGSEADGEDVAPLQHEVSEKTDLDALLPHGLGQLTRPFGTAPVDPTEGAAELVRTQRRIVEANRFGIPAVIHEECLTGINAWGATIFPTPLAWGASFDPELVGRAAELIGHSLRSIGVHQGLSPVLDVVRDPRWGRTEEAIGEDPYLVATVATAYVRGLESTGVVSTLKHFAGYSASRGARNHAPVPMGPRELADVILPPFEMAVRDGGARSVMAAYNDIDGVPASSNPWLLTELLREQWEFTGTVVADYFGVSFLEMNHQVADSPGRAAALALAAGLDVELPGVRCYGSPLLKAVRSGEVPEAHVDRAALWVLSQKCELGLLDPDWSAVPPALGGSADRGREAGGTREPDPTARVDLDPPAMRRVARQLAEESVVLLANDGGALPLDPDLRIAVVGPLADDPAPMLGCYTFPRHVGVEHPELPLGVPVPTLLQALRDELPHADLFHAPGLPARDHTPRPGGPVGPSGPTPGALGDSASQPSHLTNPVPGGTARSQSPGTVPSAEDPAPGTEESAEALRDEAVRAAAEADLCVAVVGDRSGLFGRGTSGEGCDVPDLTLPDGQGELLDALVATGTRVVLVLLTGRPYALGRWADRLAAVVQAFFPGEEGAPAVAGVLSGGVEPSGRLPVSVPRDPGGQPWTYLAPPLGLKGEASMLDPTPLYPFGHGLAYTTFDWQDARFERDAERSPAQDPDALGYATDAVPTDGEVTLGVTVRNTGSAWGTEVVQLYLHDPVARVTRPVNRLVGYARVRLAPGAAARVRFDFHADLSSYTVREGQRIVEPGALELRLGASSGDLRHALPLVLTGPERSLGHDRRLVCPARVTEADSV